MSALLLALLLTQAPDAGLVSTPLEGTPTRPEPVAEAPAPEDPRDQAIRDLQRRLEETEAEVQELKSRPSWISKLAATFSGYIDLGFFWAQGDGSGVRQDFGHRWAPQYAGQILDSWVLLGDPRSTAINSRGEVADVGVGRAMRDDPIHSGGRPTFIVNALSLGLLAQIADGLTVNARIDFLPRDLESKEPHPGDYFDLKLAYVRYALEAGPLALTFFGGKIDSVLGFEYRMQESPNRVGITPSLLCRYTCGRPIGLKVKGELFDEHLEISLALTNGSHMVSSFPFSNGSDFNRFKTVAGRVTVKLPVEPRIHLNASAAVGPQDRQPDDAVMQWHVGFAAALEWDRVFATAEFVKGQATGKTGVSRELETACAAAACLTYQGLYAQAGVHLTPWLIVYGRFDWRSARHRDGDRFVYLSDVARATAGLNVHPWKWLAVKAEYVFIRELGGYEFPDDVFTTSLVVSY